MTTSPTYRSLVSTYQGLALVLLLPAYAGKSLFFPSIFGKDIVLTASF